MNKNKGLYVKPFVKWAGGKSQLLESLRNKYSSGVNHEIVKYCEPFVGGGAVLFDILSNFSQIKEVLINDINAELINAYIQVKHNVSKMVIALLKLQEVYLNLTEIDRKIFYYDLRTNFNSLKLNVDDNTNIEKACLFIFLNKTCFNGLYRVNKQGRFNVPIGAYKKPMICDRQTFENISLLLQNVTITCGCYTESISFIDKNTFVYIDPPYRPLTATAKFTSYAETSFNDQEQIELRQFVDKLNFVGAKVVLSNSDPKNANQDDDFFDTLYENYNISRIGAKRKINSDARNRGSINELLISNF